MHTFSSLSQSPAALVIALKRSIIEGFVNFPP